jgi:cobalt/nickel transport protein
MTRPTWAFVLGAALVAILLATLVSPLASRSPGGLEKVAGDHGFLAKGQGKPMWRGSLIRDYLIPGVPNEALATAGAGLVGTMLALGAGYSFARVLRGKRTGNSGPRK